MTSKKQTMIGGAVVVSLLLLGLVPVFAQSNPSSQTDKATTIIQVAQAARGYAEQLVSIAQQHQVNTSKAESLISQGDPLLASAQSEVNTNATLAIKDALGAMNDYKAAAQSVQSALSGSFENSTADQVAYLKEAVQRAENKTAQLQSMLTKLCAAQNAATSTCSDGTTNLATVTTDLTQASAMLASGKPDVTGIVSLLKDAMQHLSAVYADINHLANAQRAQMAVTYINDVLEKQLSKLQQVIASLDPSVAQQYTQQLNQAQSLLTSALQAFQSGSFDTGVQDAKQAMQIMQTVAQGIQGPIAAQYVQNELQPKLDQLRQMAQSANLTATLKQQVQAQLDQAQSLVNGAIQSFLAGHFDAGKQEVQQAIQLMQQVYQEISSSTHKP